MNRLKVYYADVGGMVPKVFGGPSCAPVPGSVSLFNSGNASLSFTLLSLAPSYCFFSSVNSRSGGLAPQSYAEAIRIAEEREASSASAVARAWLWQVGGDAVGNTIRVGRDPLLKVGGRVEIEDGMGGILLHSSLRAFSLDLSGGDAVFLGAHYAVGRSKPINEGRVASCL